MTIENFDSDKYKDQLREQGMREDVLDDMVEKKKASLTKDESDFSYIMKLETISKSEDEHIVVAGFASSGSLDHDSEAINQDSLHAAWNEYMKNPVLRYMHGKDNRNPDTIGKVIKNYTDSNGKTYKTEFINGKPFIVAEISNAPDTESIRTKIQEGNLRGFSVGGRAKRISEFCHKVGKNINRIHVNRLSEISVVDLPANKETFFEVIKNECIGNNCNYSINESLEEITKDNDERPPKTWWNNCMSTAQKADGIKDPEAFCSWMYHNGKGSGFAIQREAIGKNEVINNYEGTNVPENENIEIKSEDTNMGEDNIEMEMAELEEFVKSTVSKMIEDQDTVEKVEGYDAAIKAAQDLRARITELEAKVESMTAQLKAQPQEAMKAEKAPEPVEETDEEKKVREAKEAKEDRVGKLESEIAELKASPMYKAEQTETVEKDETIEQGSILKSVISAHYGGN